MYLFSPKVQFFIFDGYRLREIYRVNDAIVKSADTDGRDYIKPNIFVCEFDGNDVKGLRYLDLGFSHQGQGKNL